MDNVLAVCSRWGYENELGILYILSKLVHYEISVAEAKLLLYITLLRWPPVTGELDLLISNSNPGKVL